MLSWLPHCVCRLLHRFAAAGAINTLCAGGMFDRARLLAGSNPQLLSHIEQQHTQHLVANNDAEELAARGNAAAAVEMYAAQGNWQRAHELVGGSPGSSYPQLCIARTGCAASCNGAAPGVLSLQVDSVNFLCCVLMVHSARRKSLASFWMEQSPCHGVAVF